ncbi:hypothetical protein CPT_Muldoon_075 [Serratia phage Muldoon]|uniref:Nucleotide reductase subunit C n=1 Tax=Serratia phage Muldoon TaxID=2601678 RepID=A0A5P8PH77_9CAUD|nr:ribonucleotide reductase [Serratia phage Muldoon]QFR56031.1 hypothetical protein CPT_Muldoon_075 [Serratia phage Muldoon]
MKELVDILKLITDEFYENGKEPGDSWELVDEDDWTDEGKYQYRSDVYFVPEHDVHVCVSSSRSGSYWSDWYYGEYYFSLVTPVTKVVTTVTYPAIEGDWNQRSVQGD